MTTPSWIPPLPEPATSVAYIGRPVLGYYSPDQMRDYALAAIEAYRKSLKPVAWINRWPNEEARKAWELTEYEPWPHAMREIIPVYRLDDQP
jgi:hypothetical protein